MKIVKKIGIIILIVVAIPLVVALFTKKDYAVEKQITINKPVTEVFDYIKHLKNQNHYSKWAMRDPNMKKTYRGTDATVGFVSAWESDNEDVGSGEQEIIKITDGERVDFELRFFKPFESTEPAYMTTESMGDNQTRVKWGFSGHMNYPTNLMLLFIDFEQMIGNDLQTGLDRLKTVLEVEQNSAKKLIPKVTGIGGVFFFSDKPEETKKWYADNLGLEVNDWGASFEFRNAHRPEEINYLQWSPFKKGDSYFEPSKKEFMINYRVQNIEGLLQKLKANNVTILDEIKTYDYGKFVHIMDADGNKIELWEPVDKVFTEMGGKTNK